VLLLLRDVGVAVPYNVGDLSNLVGGDALVTP